MPSRWPGPQCAEAATDCRKFCTALLALAAITKHSSSQTNKQKMDFKGNAISPSSGSWVSRNKVLGDPEPDWGLISCHLTLSDHDSSSLGLAEAASSLASYPELALLWPVPWKQGSHAPSLSVFSVHSKQFGIFPAHSPSGQLRASLLQSSNIPLSKYHQSHCGQLPAIPTSFLLERSLESARKVFFGYWFPSLFHLLLWLDGLAGEDSL